MPSAGIKLVEHHAPVLMGTVSHPSKAVRGERALSVPGIPLRPSHQCAVQSGYALVGSPPERRRSTLQLYARLTGTGPILPLELREEALLVEGLTAQQHEVDCPAQLGRQDRERLALAVLRLQAR